MIAETESSGCRLTKWGFGKMENCETGKAWEIEPVLFCSVLFEMMLTWHCAPTNNSHCDTRFA